MSQLLHDMMTLAALELPTKVAFTDNVTSLTYQDLDHRSSQLAHLLVKQNLQLGDRVAVFMPRCAETAIAVYAILKAGGILVPIDPGMPTGGVRSLIQNCGIRFMITNPKKSRALQEIFATPGSLECVIGADESMPLDSAVKNLPASMIDDQPCKLQNANSKLIKPSDPAYIMYSSGSTGRPKGITHSHSSGLAYAKLSVATYEVTPDDVIANHSPINFDMSTFGYFSSCLAGATTLIIPAAHTRIPRSLAQLVVKEKVTIWYSVPLALQQLLAHAPLDDLDFSQLRWVLYGGEPFPPKHLKALMKKWSQARFSNVYGPAEVNQCTYYHIPASYADDERNLPVPIGKTWDETDGLIIDSEDEIVDGQTPGELVICSTTMMLGYWGQPQLNQKAFFHYTDENGSPKVYYRTGDIVSRRENGEFVFLGREDRQVKVRGYRVELNDIERTLTNHPEVEEAGVYWIVIGETKEIHATVICKDGSTAGEEFFKDYLNSCLSHYAIPNRINCVADLPRTRTGKIDRKNLKDQAQSLVDGLNSGKKAR